MADRTEPVQWFACGPAAIATTAAILVVPYRGSSANSQVGAEHVTVDTRFLHTLFLLRSGRLLWFAPHDGEVFHDQVGYGLGLCRDPVGRRLRFGARCAAERARKIRLLCAVAVVVAVVLRRGPGQRPLRRRGMRRAALFVRRARAVAAIRKGIPGILRATVAAALPRHHGIHARSDAGAASDLQRVGQARHLHRGSPRALFSRPSARRAPR